MARTGAIVVGRWMYEAAGHWGDKNPWDIPVFVVTHRPEEEPDSGEFNFVGGFGEAIERARTVAGDKDVAIGGGADVIRQGLDAGVIDELAIIVAPVILGGGKALFDGFTKSLDLEHIGVRQMQWATLIEYRLKKWAAPAERAGDRRRVKIGVHLRPPLAEANLTRIRAAFLPAITRMAARPEAWCRRPGGLLSHRSSRVRGRTATAGVEISSVFCRARPAVRPVSF